MSLCFSAHAIAQPSRHTTGEALQVLYAIYTYIYIYVYIYIYIYICTIWKFVMLQVCENEISLRKRPRRGVHWLCGQGCGSGVKAILGGQSNVHRYILWGEWVWPIMVFSFQWSESFWNQNLRDVGAQNFLMLGPGPEIWVPAPQPWVWRPERFLAPTNAKCHQKTAFWRLLFKYFLFTFNLRPAYHQQIRKQRHIRHPRQVHDRRCAGSRDERRLSAQQLFRHNPGRGARENSEHGRFDRTPVARRPPQE